MFSTITAYTPTGKKIEKPHTKQNMDLYNKFLLKQKERRARWEAFQNQRRKRLDPQSPVAEFTPGFVRDSDLLNVKVTVQNLDQHERSPTHSYGGTKHLKRDSVTLNYSAEKSTFKKQNLMAKHGSTSMIKDFPENYLQKMNPKARRTSCLSQRSIDKYNKYAKSRSKSLVN